MSPAGGDAGRRTWDVYIQATEGDRRARPLAASDATEVSPAWSPAGDTVAYVVTSSEGCAIVAQAALGGPVDRLAECDPTAWYHLEWQSNTDALIVARAGDAPGLFRVDRSTRMLTRLTEPPAGFLNDMHPRVSPDGSKLAFVRTRVGGISDIYVTETAAPAAVRRLTHDNRRISGLAWLPDGRTLLFTSNRGGNSHLWRLSADGGAPQRVPMSGRNAGYLSMSASGSLVYEEYNGDSNIWEIRPGSSTVSPWSTDMRSEWSPQVSPDGSRIAFVSDRSGSAEVWLSDRDGSRPQRLTDLQGAVLDPPRWSPDGRSLAYSAARQGHFDIYTVDAASADTRRITEDPGDERAPSWSSDTELLFASNKTGDWELWRRNLETEEVERVTRDGGFGSAAGIGGKLYYTKPDRPGLFVVDSSGVPTLLWDEIQAADWGNFAIAGNRIFYLRVANATAVTLLSFDSKTGGTQTFDIPATEAPGLAGVSVAPDGAVYYSQIDRSESDLWLIRFPGSDGR